MERSHTRLTRRAALALAPAFLAACAVPPEKRAPATETEIAALAHEIRALGDHVDHEEAARAARIAYRHTRELAIAYQITDPPLIHNTKVNMGLRPRGLCWHWAEDMEKRLAQESFRTLDLHRAIANADNEWLIDHSTVIIGAEGDAWDEGIVLDPWRQGGTLFWDQVKDDTRYRWVNREDVFDWKRRQLIAEGKWPPAEA
ncbi:hypothetical protein GQ651_03690 [Alphaproteobacteria bacterium GH1-50]|uniref:Lipoprotein n=1 Tax=Kangsaoukella pontilimi TaxID=2691042 RepID=A0A7C9IPM1_9RHOB|nr:hypothetical protein [Kangsaoukella pontilimi]MXQ06943.1 hypothetical protein [Kangsaoukella pontilimi]